MVTQSVAKDVAALRVTQGDHNFKRHLLDASMTVYEIASKNLQDVTVEQYIDQLDIIEKRWDALMYDILFPRL